VIGFSAWHIVSAWQGPVAIFELGQRVGFAMVQVSVRIVQLEIYADSIGISSGGCGSTRTGSGMIQHGLSMGITGGPVNS